MIPDSALWRFVRRRQYSRNLVGFKAHLLTYATADCRFDDYVTLHRDSKIFSSSLGRATYVIGANLSRTTTGNFCSFGSGSRIGLARHPTNYLSTHPALYSSGTQTQLHLRVLDEFPEKQEVNIGSDVWIGTNCLVMGGLTIGDGAIIGAGSIVTKDVPPYAIAAGNPASIIRYRFDSATIQMLQELQWWDKSNQEIEKLARLVSPQGPIDTALLERLGKTFA